VPARARSEQVTETRHEKRLVPCHAVRAAVVPEMSSAHADRGGPSGEGHRRADSEVNRRKGRRQQRGRMVLREVRPIRPRILRGALGKGTGSLRGGEDVSPEIRLHDQPGSPQFAPQALQKSRPATGIAGMLSSSLRTEEAGHAEAKSPRMLGRCRDSRPRGQEEEGVNGQAGSHGDHNRQGKGRERCRVSQSG
jgi:hypothetical protein